VCSCPWSKLLNTQDLWLCLQESSYMYWSTYWKVWFKSSLTLRPTVRRPVSLGIKHPSGAYDQIFIIVRQLHVCWFGALSVTRVRVCRLQFWSSPAQSFSSPSPLGLATMLYCLRFETSLFVASYDSQDYGGSILPPLNMGDLSLIKFLATLLKPYPLYNSWYNLIRNVSFQIVINLGVQIVLILRTDSWNRFLS
jgi:hypothetical protein